MEMLINHKIFYDKSQDNIIIISTLQRLFSMSHMHNTEQIHYILWHFSTYRI